MRQARTDGLAQPKGAAIRAAMARDGETFPEEFANALTHGIAAVLAAAALALLIVLAAETDSARAVATSAVYGTTLFLAFLFSSLYHGSWHAPSKSIFLVLDHCAIFLLIAGTYTPLTLLVFPQPLGWVLFGIIWGLAVIGITIRIWMRRSHWLLVPIFLAMGWLAAIWSPTLFETMSTAGAWLVLSGGLAYTCGVLFYLWRSLPFNHAIWHLWVLAGGVCHYLAIAIYAIPKAA